jgi:amino acid adenylation domain-containing protein
MDKLTTELQAAFLKFADRPALQCGGNQVSYRDLWAMAEACASRIDAQAPLGGRVAVLARRTPAAYAAVLAAVLSRRPYVPVYPKAPPERQRAIHSAAQCVAYLYDANSEAAAVRLSKETGGAAICVDPVEPSRRAVIPGDADHAYIMFTSGSTGAPKGVAVRRDNVAAYLSAFQQIAPLQPTDRCTQFFDLSFDLSVHDLLVTWSSGACLCAPSEDELIDPVGFAQRNDVTCWFSVPSIIAMARRMRRLGPGALPRLRLSLFCGEPLPTSLAMAWSDAAPNGTIWNLYGPTETTIAITGYRFDRPKDAAAPATVPLGKPYANCAAVVVNADGTLAACGEVGELWLAGAQLSDGYINNPSEQAAKFIEAQPPGHDHRRWYRSGDLVRRDADWGLVYVGRLDDQFKISGHRVELLEIEEALRWAAGASEVAIVAWPLGEGGSAEGVVGFVCGAKFAARETILRCRTLLPPYMVPKRIVALERLPLNANGKFDRKALRRAHLELPSS